MKIGRWGVMLAVIWAGAAQAVTVDGYEIPYVAAQYAHEFGDSSRDSKQGNGYQLTFGWPLASLPNTAVEGFFYDVGRERDIDGNKDYQSVLGVDLVHDLGLMSVGGDFGQRYLPRFKPFGLAGLEAVHEDVRGERRWHPAGNLGAGLLFPLPWYGAAVRTEGRVQVQANDHSVANESVLIDYRFTVGVQIPLTPLFPEHKAPAPVNECAVQVISLNGIRRGDCGETDSDHDGVPDGRDACPNTPAGSTVDPQGCPVSGPQVPATMLDGVRFDNDSTQLSAEAKTILDAAAINLKQLPPSKIEVAGYTDNVAAPAYNQQLSQRRAEVVRDYLIGKGVAAERISARGYGEADPRQSNDSESGRQANRRVELHLTP